MTMFQPSPSHPESSTNSVRITSSVKPTCHRPRQHVWNLPTGSRWPFKIDQNPKDSTLPSNVRMIWAMAILWIVWDLSLFRDLHKVLGGLPWPTVAYRGLAWPTVAYRGLPSSWAVWQLLPFQLQFPASGSPIWTEDGLVFKWCKNVKKCCEYKKWIQGKRWKWWK